MSLNSGFGFLCFALGQKLLEASAELNPVSEAFGSGAVALGRCICTSCCLPASPQNPEDLVAGFIKAVVMFRLGWMACLGCCVVSV